MLMIDVRSYRDPEVPANDSVLGALDLQDSRVPPGPDMFDPERTTLGARQKRWLERRLRRSRAGWRVVGNPYNINPWKFVDFDTPEARAANPDLSAIVAARPSASGMPLPYCAEKRKKRKMRRKSSRIRARASPIKRTRRAARSP